MNFLAPLFFLGALAVAGPIIFHLIRRTTREVTPFSTLMFLQPSPPRITKRSRLENFWLLLLRCLVLGLIAAAFSRPFFRESMHSPLAAAGEGHRRVLLIDTSASQRRENLWAELKNKVAARIEAAAPADEIALIAFDRTPREVLGFEEWRRARPEERRALAAQRLSLLAPGWAGTQLDQALLRAAEMLEHTDRADAPALREIVVFSDLQEGAHVDALQGYVWPQHLSVSLEPLAAKQTENAGLAWLPETEQQTGTAKSEATPIRLRVTNAAGAQHEQFKLQWRAGDKTVGTDFDAYVPAGKARVIRVPQPPAGADRVVLSGDDTAFDNTTYVLPPQPARIPVLFLGQDEDEDPRGLLYYLHRAFPSTGQQQVQLTAHRSAEAVPGFLQQTAQFIVVGDRPSDAALDSVRPIIEGGHLALVPFDSPEASGKAARLLGVPALTVSEAAVRDYAMLAKIDFQHPFFSAFADPRFSDFTKIHFWKHRRIDLAGLKDARTLASFDSGDPALVQVPLGRGSVILLATTWRPADSQLALSSKFLPLLQAMLDQSSHFAPVQAQYFVGDEIALPESTTPLTVRTPSGREVPATGPRFAATDEPGIYQVTPGTLRFVVNLPAEESRTQPLTTERFSALGVPLTQNAKATAEQRAREARAQAAEIENRQKIWRWLLLATLLLVAAETLLAGRLTRASATPAPTA